MVYRITTQNRISLEFVFRKMDNIGCPEGFVALVRYLYLCKGKFRELVVWVNVRGDYHPISISQYQFGFSTIRVRGGGWNERGQCMKLELVISIPLLQHN